MKVLFHSLHDVETIVKEVMTDLLKDTTNPLDFDKSFVELGISSVLSVEMVEMMNRKLGIDLGIEVVFDHENTKLLAAHIFEKYQPASRTQSDNGSSAIASKISKIIAHLLDTPVEALNFDKSFIELGIHSVLAVELIEAINADLGINLGVEAIFDYTEVGELAEYISLQFATEMAADESQILPTVFANEIRHSDIAIIGIAGRFAGSDSVEEFWEHLASGDSCIEEITRSGWEADQYYGGLLKDIDQFDASFFNITPDEAKSMDPQQRLFLQESYKAFEDSGYSVEQLSGRKVGVFVGGRQSDYKEKSMLVEGVSSQTMLGNEMSMLGARLSYFFNLKGPSLAVDTACSSALVAIHLACDSLRRGETEMALAGGVAIHSSPEFYVMSSQMGVVSPDGTCNTFDNAANGMVFGEGVGAVVLKPVAKAVEDGDHIYAIIKGSTVNQTGKSNGITAPSMLAQKELIVDAYENAGVDPETISYIETHGTGTQLGDPIEVKALVEAFRSFTDKAQFCAIGSHKPNIGHATMTSGLASLFKVVMAMKYKKIAPTISVKEVNKHIKLSGSPFFINTELMEWNTSDATPRRAGVSALGSNGTNCHLILEESPTVQPQSSNQQAGAYYLFPFSAKSESALTQKLDEMSRWLAKEAGRFHEQDISYTLLTGRSHFSHRCMFIAKDAEELRQKITEVKETGTAADYFVQDETDSVRLDASLKEFGEKLMAEVAENRSLTNQSRKEKLSTLADLFVKGYKLDWGSFYNNGKYTRVPLPAYPFRGERYWLPKTERPNRLPNTHPELWKEMDELLAKLLWAQMQSIGWFTAKSVNVADLKAKTGFPPRYEKWMEESIAMLTRHGYLDGYDGEQCLVVDPTLIEVDAVWEEWDRRKVAWREDANLEVRIRLLEATMKSLPHIVTGKRLATDVMFPGSSMELVQHIYKNNPVADHYNEVLAETVATYVEERVKKEPSAKIRILEIGAGTGGTSTFVFEKLKPYQEFIEEYCYTDISKAFLMFAQKEYGPHVPYLTYQIFNVEAPFAEQGVREGYYDLVIAANVLHATKDIHRTLRHTKAVLRENGLVLLNEISSNSLFLHLTFGLLEGWWLSEDTDVRIPGSPALTPACWQTVLEKEGFHTISFPAREAHDLGQQIVIGKSDGVLHPGVRVGATVSPIARETEQQAKPEGKVSSQPAPQYIPSESVVTEQTVTDYVKDMIIEKLVTALEVDVDSIDVDEPFRDYGLDSILGVRLVQEINQALVIEIETTILFDYSTVNQLTGYILSEYNEVIARALGQKISLSEQREESVSAIQTEPFIQAAPMLSAETGSMSEKASYLTEPIAIIGMSGTFASAGNADDLWEHLVNGSDLLTKVRRWDLSAYGLDDAEGYQYGGLVENIDLFDPLFFNISGLEADYMDPQQRFFLEESWKALEDAGYAGQGVQGIQCGVYAGCAKGDYDRLVGENPPAQAFWGNMESIVPARVAYHLDLQGPAVTIDTACSSSLVAIHMACQALRTGEVDMALAGGVFIQSTPGFYLSAKRAGMLSPTGRCHTFDERADGFATGEGAGVVVLKRLSEAMACGDHIYGVIRGSGINQDGTTNGITAPSAKSQERLERKVYDTFDINPEQITMVEAHGTGTKLGDPIEYQALTRAFRAYTDKEGFCAIGSIKTNIGHTQIAAGVAGVIKILLSLKHKQIAPSLHFETGNANITFDGSPFYVNTILKEWSVESQAKRCAAISSFGASGTNAHMVIEEAPQIERIHAKRPGYLLVLSARTFEQLRQQVVQLLSFCEKAPETDCGNISYTLLVGRKHFHHRFACIAQNTAELVQLLKKWLETGRASQVFVSELNEKDHREQTALKRYGNQSIENLHVASQASEYLEQLSVIAELFVQGYRLDYDKLFANDQYSRIPLPTYPFAKERHWVLESEAKANARGAATTITASVIHPMLHQNTSTFSEQRFSSTFTGEEFFLADHVVKGQRVLPGVAYLEMARSAMEHAIGENIHGDTAINLHNVVWARPIVVGDQPVRVHTGLVLEEDGEVSYQIYSEAESSDAEIVVHSQGNAVLAPRSELPMLDLPVLQEQCGEQVISSEEFYEFFRAIQIDYGRGHKGIDKVYVGRGQVLAKLVLPLSVTGSEEQFVLHPSLMDSALQASVELTLSSRHVMSSDSMAKRKPVMPFALEEIEIISPCTTEMWAYVRYSDGSQAGDKVEKYDIDLCDDSGAICVRMKGFTSRVLEREIQTDPTAIKVPVETSSESLIGTMLLSPVWEEVVVNRGSETPLATDRILIVCADDENRSLVQQRYPQAAVMEITPAESIDELAIKLEQVGSIDHIIWIAPWIDLEYLAEEALIIEQERGVFHVFRLLKALLKLGYDTKELGWSLVTFQTQPIHQNDVVNPIHASLYGLVGSMAKEYTNWRIRLVDLEADRAWPMEEVFTLPPDAEGNATVYRGGKWYRQELIPLRQPQWEQASYRQGGVYVVIGGAGGIGEVWSEYMISTYQAQIIWIGRREKNAEIQAKVDRLAKLGPAPVYIAADATNRKSLYFAYEEIKKRYKQVNGVIHSAIVLLDKSLANMDEERFRAGLSAKVDVSVRIAQVFDREPLDFVMFFSSINSFTKSPGQSNYASGCTFKDIFAHQLSLHSLSAVKVMNWGYWANVGIVATKDYQERMAQAGLGSIEPREAMTALESLLAGPMNQVALVKITKSQAMLTINPDKSIYIYPEKLVSHIERVKNDMPKLEFSSQRRQSEMEAYK